MTAVLGRVWLWQKDLSDFHHRRQLAAQEQLKFEFGRIKSAFQGPEKTVEMKRQKSQVEIG